MERPIMGTQQDFFNEHLSKTPIIAILRGFSAERAVKLAEEAWNSGIGLVEVPIQDESGRIALNAVASRANDLGRQVGAGTVLKADDVNFAHSIGCSFTVAPGFDPQVVERATSLNVYHLPGVATATEVSNAQSLGLIWQKAFPARELGVGWISSMQGPFPAVKFIATGGIDVSNLSTFLDGGAHALGIGSAFSDPQILSAIRNHERNSRQ
jgi:2-dehydro-3-deoxyphosphogluconate aldolase/(4S)-4-hydroxy-2-oxoglutarate aldolase